MDPMVTAAVSMVKNDFSNLKYLFVKNKKVFKGVDTSLA